MEKFSHEFNGYNKREVNQFLNNTITELEGIIQKGEMRDQKMQQQSQVIEEQNRRLVEQNTIIQDLNNQLVHYKSIETTLQKAIYNAEEASSNMKRMAQEEANLIIDEAKQNASRIVNDALIRAEKIELKTDTAERNLRIFKNRLKAIVEQQEAVVQEIEVLELED